MDLTFELNITTIQIIVIILIYPMLNCKGFKHVYRYNNNNNDKNNYISNPN